MGFDRFRRSDESERGRVLDMARRLRPVARSCGALAVAAAAIGLPTFGSGPVVALILAAVTFDIGCAWLARSEHVEVVVCVSWLAGASIVAGGIALAAGPQLYLLPMLAYPLIFLAVLLPGRVAVPAAVLSVLTIVGLALGLDGSAVARFPPLVLYPIATVLVTTLGASLAREKDVASRRSAFVDELTGLLNRASLASRVGELAHQASRGERVAVLVGDIDHFKAINDRHGHARGDGVLAAVAAGLECRAHERLLPVQARGRGIRRPAAGRRPARGRGTRPSACARRSPAPSSTAPPSRSPSASRSHSRRGSTSRRVLAAADDALYRAKRTGRDRVCGAEQADTVVALRSTPTAERRAGPTCPDRGATSDAGVPPAPLTTQAVRGGGPPATPARAVRRSPRDGLLVRDKHERAQLVALAQRSQLFGLMLIYPCAVAAVVAAIPDFGWWIPVPPTIGAMVLVGTVALLPRLRRPERALAAAWLIAELGAAGGWFVAHPHTGVSMIVALPALGMLVATFSPAFSPRVVAVGAGVSGLLMVIVAYGFDTSLATKTPGIVAVAIALMVTMAVIGCTVGRSTVDHLEVGVVDELTGMLNRAALKARTVELSRPAMRHAQIALIVGDLDQLKRVNDELGHAAGDAVLREVSRRVRGELRAFDTVYRIGGDEFVALLPSIDEDAGSVAERLRVAVRASPIGEAPVTVSIGVAVSQPGEAFDYPTLFASRRWGAVPGQALRS